MAAVTAIPINDGQATPVGHTFSPARTSSDFAQYEDRAAGVYVGYNKLTITLSRPVGKPGTRNLKLSIKIETPKLETLGTSSSGFTPAPSVAYRPTVEVIATFPERCVLQDRKDLRAYIIGILQTTTAQVAFESYEMPY